MSSSDPIFRCFSYTIHYEQVEWKIQILTDRQEYCLIVSGDQHQSSHKVMSISGTINWTFHCWNIPSPVYSAIQDIVGRYFSLLAFQ